MSNERTVLGGVIVETEFTADEEKRQRLMQRGGLLIDKLLRKHFGVSYNLVILACPRSGDPVSMVSKVVSDEALCSILIAGLASAGVEQVPFETLQ